MRKEVIKRVSIGMLFVGLIVGMTLQAPVQTQAAKIKMSKKKITLTVGKKKKLKLKNTKKKYKIKWKSSKKKVAKVSTKGVVTARKPGKAVITATYKKKKYKCTVTVIAKKTDVDTSNNQPGVEKPVAIVVTPSEEVTTATEISTTEPVTEAPIEQATSAPIEEETTAVTHNEWVVSNGSGEISLIQNGAVLTVEGTGEIPDYYPGEAEWLNADVSTLVISDNITSVGDYAFENMPIENVNMGGVTTIGKYSFYNTNVQSVDLTGIEIAKGSFSNCDNLVSVILGAKNIDIPDYCFDNCISLESLIIPDTVTSVGLYSFRNCPINQLSIPATTVIEATSFDGNTSLTKLTITKGIDKVVDYTPALSQTTPWHNAASELTVVINNDVVGLGERWFYGCETLKKLTMPHSLTFEATTFAGCFNISDFIINQGMYGRVVYTESFMPYLPWNRGTDTKTVTLTNGVNLISAYMFASSGSNVTINIPLSVRTIESNAFYKSSAVINYSGTSEDFSRIIVADGWNAQANLTMNYN